MKKIDIYIEIENDSNYSYFYGNGRTNNRWYNARGNGREWLYGPGDQECCNNPNNIMGYPQCPPGMPGNTGDFNGTSPTPGFGYDTYTNIGVNCDTGSPLGPDDNGGIGPVNPTPVGPTPVDPPDVDCSMVDAGSPADQSVVALACNQGTIPANMEGLCECSSIVPLIAQLNAPDCSDLAGDVGGTQLLAQACVNNYNALEPQVQALCDCSDTQSYIGCNDPTATNYNPNSVADDGSCQYPPTAPCYQCQGQSGSMVGIGITTEADCQAQSQSWGVEDNSICPIGGCTDSSASNYNPNATTDNGTCEYTPDCNTIDSGSSADQSAIALSCYQGSIPADLEFLCDCSSIVPLINQLNEVPGCTDSSANNYNPSANTNDGSCTYDVPGCTNYNATNYNPNATVDDGSCVVPEEGTCAWLEANSTPSYQATMTTQCQEMMTNEQGMATSLQNTLDWADDYCPCLVDGWTPYVYVEPEPEVVPCWDCTNAQWVDAGPLGGFAYTLQPGGDCSSMNSLMGTNFSNPGEPCNSIDCCDFNDAPQYDGQLGFSGGYSGFAGRTRRTTRRNGWY